MTTAHHEVVRAIEPHVEQSLAVLKPAHRAWQPTDLLPDLSAPTWADEVALLRERASAVPDELLVVLVGDTVTEEALPSYSMALNQLVRDDEGTSPAAWARWLRGWTAEENRHGDVLSTYLRLSGRVDMRAVEQTVHALLADGFAVGAGEDPYSVLVYTSFQERATRISHASTGRIAADAGDAVLARICRTIAGDEARHEVFYSRMMGHVLDLDPSGGIEAFARMLDRRIAMPGRLMTDGRDPSLFEHFAAVAQRIGVYTAHDYAEVVGHLTATWNIAGRSVSGAAARAQETICRAAERHERVAGRIVAGALKQPRRAFSWIQGRTA